MAELPRNEFKRALEEGRQQIGLWSSLNSPIVADILGEAGFDWIVLDSEHATNELPETMLQMMALRSGTGEPVIRPPWNDMVIIKRFLDAGARTLLIPMIESAEEARAAVASTRYPPDGVRGVATAVRASRYGLVPNYHARAAEEICTLLQVETRKGMDAIDEIAAVEGVDGIFIGPSDLAAALGHLGNPTHPEVQAAISHCLARCKAAGKPAGILTSQEDLARGYAESGFLFVAVGSDTGLLLRNAKELAARFRPDS
jgi:4-hydroxy-2-oxoheptanedioate aldolase